MVRTGPSSDLVRLVDMKLFPDPLVIKVQEMIKGALEHGEKVSAAEQILNLLEHHQLLWVSQTPPEQVDVSIYHRKAFGVGAHQAQMLGEQILAQGFSWARCKEVLCMELPPAPHDEAEVTFNAELQNIANDVIPATTNMRRVSIAGSHTNTFLRQVKAGSPCVIESLADHTGCFDFQKLKAGRKDFEEAVVSGLKWRTLAWQVPVVWEDLPDLLQESLNTQAVGGQSEIEVMLAIHQSGEAHYRMGRSEVDWKLVEKTATYTNPSCANWVGSLSLFVKHCAGGGELLQELQEFSKAFGPKQGMQRVLGSEFLTKVATLNFGAGCKMPFLQTAIVKAQLASPSHRVIDGQCRLLSASNVASVISKDKKAAAADIEALLTEARNLVKTMPAMDAGKRTTIIGQLDCRCVFFLLKKGKEMESRGFQ